MQIVDHMFDRVVMQGWTSLLSLLYFVVLLWPQNYSAALGLWAWWFFSLALKVWPSLRRGPVNWLILPIFYSGNPSLCRSTGLCFLLYGKTGLDHPWRKESFDALDALAALAATTQLPNAQRGSHQRHPDQPLPGAEHLLFGNPFRPACLAAGCFQIERFADMVAVPRD